MLDLISDFYMEIVPQWLSENILGKISDAVNSRIKNNEIKRIANLMFILLFIPLSIGLALGILIFITWVLLLLNVI